MLGREACIWEEEKTFVFKIVVITSDSMSKSFMGTRALRPAATCDVSKPLQYSGAGAGLQGEKEGGEEVKVS